MRSRGADLFHDTTSGEPTPGVAGVPNVMCTQRANVISDGLFWPPRALSTAPQLQLRADRLQEQIVRLMDESFLLLQVHDLSRLGN